jgi:hypothetical protein
MKLDEKERWDAAFARAEQAHRADICRRRREAAEAKRRRMAEEAARGADPHPGFLGLWDGLRRHLQ